MLIRDRKYILHYRTNSINTTNYHVVGTIGVGTIGFGTIVLSELLLSEFGTAAWKGYIHTYKYFNQTQRKKF